jgi:hypothetical protein
MKKIKGFIATFVVSMICITNISIANAADEDIVFLKKNCDDVGSNQLCFTTIENVETWVWTTRQPAPSVTSPVTVKIGPGSFTGILNCNNSGYVNFIGSGSANTTLVGTANAIVGNNCEELHFQDMKIVSSSQNYPLLWQGGGSSRWINVDVIGKNRAWHDSATLGCEGNPTHYWINSKLSTAEDQGVVYETECGESWFYGSELSFIGGFELTGPFGTFSTSQGKIITANVEADVRVFGSVLRGVIEKGKTPFFGEVVGVELSGNSKFHMHGGIISIDQSAGTGINVKAIVNNGSGIIHTPDTAYALKPGNGGTVTRITNTSTGTVKAPFQWPASTTPPAISTQSGSDTFVETDCDSTGNCSGNSQNPQHPHLMIFDTTCNINGPWFDVATNACRK